MSKIHEQARARTSTAERRDWHTSSKHRFCHFLITAPLDCFSSQPSLSTACPNIESRRSALLKAEPLRLRVALLAAKREEAEAAAKEEEEDFLRGFGGGGGSEDMLLACQCHEI